MCGKCEVVESALCGGRNGGLFTYVQLSIQSLLVDQPLGTKHVRLPLCYTQIATCVIRKTATLYHT